MKRIFVALAVAGALMAQDAPKVVKKLSTKEIATEAFKLADTCSVHLNAFAGQAESYFNDYDNVIENIINHMNQLNQRLEVLEKENKGLKARLAAMTAIAALNPK